MGQNSLRKKRWLGIGLFVGLFAVLVVLSCIEAYVSQLIYDKPISWGLALRRSFKEWLACGTVAIGVVWFCQRNRLEAGRGKHWFLIHFGAAFVFSLANVALLSLLLVGERSVQTGEILTFSYLFNKMVVHAFTSHPLMYWIVVLGHLGWQYYQRYRERELQAAQLQRELVEAKLDALRMQLNPHFLFNTLHAISSLIHENPEAADRVVARLSELLRVSLDHSKAQELPLSQELAFLDRYLEIEQTRFADRLKIEKHVEAGLQDALVPCLILQPLVENAIRHGIEPREEMGHLAIRARRNNGMLELTVSDNGPGFADEASAPPREGIGLSNTRSRLLHLYGENHRLELVSAPGGGLEARISIPYRTENTAT